MKCSMHVKGLLNRGTALTTREQHAWSEPGARNHPFSLTEAAPRKLHVNRLGLLQVVIISLIVGSLFSFQAHGQENARAFFGVSFLTVMFLAMGAMPELAITLSMKG